MRLATPLVLMLVLPLGAGAPAGPDPGWTRTTLDADGDGIHDALAPQLRQDGPIVVLLSYAAMPTDGQLRAVHAAGARVVERYAHFPILAVEAVPHVVPDLARLPGVVLVEPNHALVPWLRESVPLIGAPLAWSRHGVSGNGVVVAVLDDGAYEQHPDFEGKVVGRYDAAAPRAPFGGETDRAVAPAGQEGHGTHVAGTATGTGAEAGGAYRGAAPAARFVNVKVFSGPNQTTTDMVLRGLDWTLAHMEQLQIRIAILSLGGKPSDGTDALSRAADLAVDKGLVLIAAAGNAGPEPGTVTSPAAAQKVIAVGAVDKRKQVADFSSRGPTSDGRLKPDLVAPGVGIVSTVPPASTSGVGGILAGRSSAYYGSLSGTSMSAPHVAGVAALMLEANPDLTPLDVRRILLATAQDLGAEGPDPDTGFGLVNAHTAVQVARDPSLLQSPRFRDILAQIPEPQEPAILDRLATEAQAAARQVPGLGAALLVLTIGVAARLRPRP